MAITTIEYQTSAMDAPARITIRHRHKVRAELSAARRGWPQGTAAPLALISIAAHFAAREIDPTIPADFDTWMDNLDDFEFIESTDVDPTNAAQPSEPL